MRPTKFEKREVTTIIEEELDSWAFDSHLWITFDVTSSIEECKWCGHIINGYQGVCFKDFPLCKKNPKVLEILNEPRTT